MVRRYQTIVLSDHNACDQRGIKDRHQQPDDEVDDDRGHRDQDQPRRYATEDGRSLMSLLGRPV
jgi:hypothetical protein